jgi:nitrogen-specific signal transduction histidine kinase
MTVTQDGSALALRVLDAMPFAVIGLTRRETVSFVNPAAETLLQRSSALVRGRPLTELLPASITAKTVSEAVSGSECSPNISFVLISQTP